MCIVTLVHAFKRHWHSLGGVRWFFRSFGNLVICVMFTVLMVFLMVEWLQAEPPVGLFAPPPPRVSSIYGGCLSTWCGFCISVAGCIVASVPPKREINGHWYKPHCYVNSTNMSMNNRETLLQLTEYFICRSKKRKEHWDYHTITISEALWKLLAITHNSFWHDSNTLHKQIYWSYRKEDT